MSLQRVDPAGFLRQPWANGGGITTELAAGPDRARWRWRISVAQVERAGGFSALPGVRRQIAPLDVSLRLHFPDGRDVTLNRLQVLAFDGDPPPRCELPDGPGRDVNLMLRDGAAGTLIARPLTGSMLLPGDGAQRWFAWLPTGHARLAQGADSLELAAGEAAWVEPGGENARLEGAGEIVLARLDAI